MTRVSGRIPGGPAVTRHDPGRAAAFAQRWDVPLRAVESGPGALAAVPAVLARFVPIAELALVVDGTPMTYRDGDVHAAVRRLLPAGTPTRTVTAAGGDHGPVLDEATIAAALDAARGASLLLAVGSGTVTDLAKQVAAELDVPVVVVQTAASVNGYADSLSVLVRNGAKRTVPSTWPSALIVDHDVLRGAPDRLTRAGVGDATAAWTVARRLVPRLRARARPRVRRRGAAAGARRRRGPAHGRPGHPGGPHRPRRHPDPGRARDRGDRHHRGPVGLRAPRQPPARHGRDGRRHRARPARGPGGRGERRRRCAVGGRPRRGGPGGARPVGPRAARRPARAGARVLDRPRPERPGRGRVLGRGRAEVRDVDRAPQRHGPVPRPAGSRTRRPCAATPSRRRSRPGRCTGGVHPCTSPT